MTTACRRAEADGEFLNDVEDRHEQELQQKQGIAPTRSALRGGDQAPDIGVGEHHDKTGSCGLEKRGYAGQVSGVGHGIATGTVKAGSERPSKPWCVTETRSPRAP